MPLEKVGFDVLEVAEHLGGGVGLGLEGGDEGVQLFAVLLFGLGELLPEKAEQTLHYYTRT